MGAKRPKANAKWPTAEWRLWANGVETFNSAAQRARLLEFAGALGSRSSALQRDECGDWAIFGRYGHIFAVPLARRAEKTGFHIVYSPCSPLDKSPRAWGHARKAIGAFACLALHGGSGGTFLLDRLPTAAEATTLLGKLGIPKKRTLSEKTLASLRAAGVASRFGRQKFAFSAWSEG